MVVEDLGMVLGMLELICRRVEYDDIFLGGVGGGRMGVGLVVVSLQCWRVPFWWWWRWLCRCF